MKLHRLAVAILFFNAGFNYANWVARIPEIQASWNVSNSMLGSILLSSAAGSVIAMPFAGAIMVKFNSRQVSIFTALSICLLIPLIPLLNTIWLIFPCFFIIGALGGAMDVAINGQAIYVERMYQKPIMSSFHAVFSIGTALGAGSGALFAKFEIPLFTHFLITASTCLFLALWAMRHLVFDNTPKENTEGGTSGGGFRLPTKAILPLGIIAFCGMTGEGTMADWSALYMNKIIGQSVSFSALAFGAFATAMTIGRILGDRFIEKYGSRKVLIFNSITAFSGLLLSVTWLNPYIVLIGFFISGLGIATIVPIIYSKAGNTEGVVPSVGIAMATTIGYAGFFVAPPVIGYIADIFDLRIGLIFTLILFILMIYMVYQNIKD